MKCWIIWSSPSRACYLQYIGDSNIPSQCLSPYKLMTPMTFHRSFRGSSASPTFPLACLRRCSKSVNSFFRQRFLHFLLPPVVIGFHLTSSAERIVLSFLSHHLINNSLAFFREMAPHCFPDQSRKLMPVALIDSISIWDFFFHHFDLSTGLR
jgi:hypothetical protein